jgi:hypothetical protein
MGRSDSGVHIPQIRVAVVSAVPTQIKATVAAYVVQKDQVSNLERWHPAQHVVTESLSGAVVTQTIVCNGSHHEKLPTPAPGKHQGVAEFKFTGRKTFLILNTFSHNPWQG